MRAWRSVQVLAAACCAAIGAGQALAQPLPNSGAVPEAVPFAVAPPAPIAPVGYTPPMGQAFPSLAPATPNLADAAHCPQCACPDCGFRGCGSDADGWYIYSGAMGLKRNAPPSFPVTTLDPGVIQQTTDFLTVPVRFQTAVGTPILTGLAQYAVLSNVTVHPDTGTTVPAGTPTFGDFKDANPGYDWGYRMAIGCRMDDYAFEFSGYYLFTHGTSLLVSSNQLANVDTPPQIVTVGAPAIAGVTNPIILAIGASFQDLVDQLHPPQPSGRLLLPFFNAPAGFAGTNGLWLQADQVVVHNQSALGNFEFNTRYWYADTDVVQFQVLGGLRYVDVKEKFGILTQDDALVIGKSPTLDANYQVDTGNHMLMAQLGGDWELHLGALFSLDFMAKGAWGINFIDSEVSLTRGDGLVGFDETRHTTNFSQLYELGLFGQVCIGSHIRIKGGYETMWVFGVADAYDQIDYDLSHHTGRNQNDGSLFYHGPVMELQIHF